jgi:hypothetical protein
LDLVFGIFNKDFQNKTIDELTIDCVKEYFNQLWFINWDLMIRLFNLKTSFYNGLTITNSFMALIVGVVTNILVKKATKQIKNALKDADARKESISVVGKLWRKVRAMK